MTEFAQRRIDVGEVTLHVAEAGPADGPLVVFLHGFPEFWWSWRHQLEAFGKAGFHAVAPDMRGYDESDKPEGVAAYEIEKLTADVAGLIRALGREEAMIVGHDWGAVVAWGFAMIYPAMTTRLAILNVPHPAKMQKGLYTWKQMKKSWYIFFFQLPFVPESGMAANGFASIRKLFEADGVPSEEVDRYVEAVRKPGVAKAAVNYYRAAVRRMFTGRLPPMKSIHTQVLVIWGDADRYLGIELADPPARLVPHARVEHIPGASHWVQNAAPERVNELLLEFAAT